MSGRSLGAAASLPSGATRRAVRAAGLVLVLLVCGACGRDECDPGECEPCIGEQCAVTCVNPDEDELGYNCDWECSQGATCDFECEVYCCLFCDASDCTAGATTLNCSNGAHCTTRHGYATLCERSRCNHDCPGGDCVQICRDGSDCELHCGPDNERDPEVCSAACDGTSACHIACEGPCVLCCGGSTDCSMDCPDGGQSCEGDAIVCGTDCPVDRRTLEPGEDRSKYNFCPEPPDDGYCF